MLFTDFGQMLSLSLQGSMGGTFLTGEYNSSNRLICCLAVLPFVS